MEHIEGTWIDEPNVNYIPRNVEDKRVIQPIPITLYETEAIYQQGKIITVNKKYMVYSIRSGFLRVINKFTAKRGLMKGHSMQLTDVSFQSCESNVLASVNKDGSIIVWEISERGLEGNVECTKLVHLVQREESPYYYKRIKWHPHEADVFFTVSNVSQVDAWYIKHLKDGAQHIVDDLPDSAHQIIRPTCTVETTDVGVSYDGRILAVGGDEINKVALWEIPAGGIGEYQPIVEWTPHGKAAVNSLHFLGSPQNPDLAHFLITGGPYNGELKMWSIQDVRQGSIRLLQTITFCPNPTCQPPDWDEPPFLNVAQVDPSSTFFVVCNQREPTAWVFHVKTPYQNSENGLDTRLDYVTEFDVTQNVISFGLTNRVIYRSPEEEANGYEAPPGVGLICIQTKAIQLWQFEDVSPPEKVSGIPGAKTGIKDEKKEKEKEDGTISTNGAPEVTIPKSPPEVAPPAAGSNEVSMREKRRQEMLKLMGAADEASPPAVKTPTSQTSQVEVVPSEDSKGTTPQVPTAGSEAEPSDTSQTDLQPVVSDQATPTSAPASVESISTAEPSLVPPVTVTPAVLTLGPSTLPLAAVPAAEQASSPVKTAVTDEPPSQIEPSVEPPMPSPVVTAPPPLPLPDLSSPPPTPGDPNAMLDYVVRQMHTMQQLHAQQWNQMQSLMREQQTEHRRQMEELKATIQHQTQKQEESAFNLAKEQRQHMITFHNQLQNSISKQFQEMLRALSDRLKEQTDQLRPQLVAIGTQSEARQKQFSEEVLGNIKKEMLQFKEQVQSYIKYQKESNEMSKMRSKEAMDAEQQRMQKLLDTVSYTIVNTVPDSLDQKFEAKLEACVQNRILPALSASVEGKLDKSAREGIKLNFQKVLLPQIEASFQKIFDQVNATLQTSLQSQHDEIGRSLRPDMLGTSISKALADQEQLIVQTVTDQLTRALPQAIEQVLETQISKVLPNLIQRTVTEVLTKIASNPENAHPNEEVTEQSIKEEALALIRAKDYDKVFAKILGLSSLDMVEWLCNELDPKEVFEGSQSLTNPVILSLIHQLAFALGSKTHLKARWLQECVIAFNPDDPVTKHHVPDVLGQVVTMLETFLSTSTELDQKKAVRAVEMMLRSVIYHASD